MSFESFHHAGDLPCGTYEGVLSASRLVRSIRKRTPGVTLYWDIMLRSERVRVWRTVWLSPAAAQRSVQELRRVGVSSLGDLDRDPPVPAGIVCRLVIADVRSRDGCVDRSIVSWDPLSEPAAQRSGREVIDERC